MPEGIKQQRRRGDVKRIQHASADVQQVKDARIRVGATRAPQLVGVQGVKDSPLGTLIANLGDFSKGPFTQALRAQYEKDLEQKAEQAVFEGTPIDELPDQGNYIFENYYNGAMGRKLGSDITTELQQMIEAQGDDDTFDVERATKELLAKRLSPDLHPDVATNAALVVRQHAPTLIDNEKLRRTNSARMQVYYTGQEATTSNALGYLRERDWDNYLNEYQTSFAQSKKLAGIFDPKAHNQYIANDIMAALKDPTAKLKLSEIEDFEKAVAGWKMPNGASLWTNPDYGPQLRSAFSKAKGTKASAMTVDQSLWLKDKMDIAKDPERAYGLSEAMLRAQAKENGGWASAAQIADIIKTRDDTLLEDAQLTRKAQTVIGNEPATYDDKEWLNKPKELEKVSRRTYREIKDRVEATGTGASDLELEGVTAGLFARKYGRKVPWIEENALSALHSGDYAAAQHYWETMNAYNPDLLQSFGTPSDRAALQQAKVLEKVLGGDKQLIRDRINQGFENYKNGESEIRKRENWGRFEAQVRNKFGDNVAIRDDVLEMSSFLTATGMPWMKAMNQAIAIYEANSTEVDHGVRMTPANSVINWGNPDVRREVRKTNVKPYLEDLGFDTGSWLELIGFRGTEADVVIRPITDGRGILETPDGRLIGIVPLQQWADEGLDTLQKAELKRQHESDVKRAADLKRRPAQDRRPGKNR